MLYFLVTAMYPRFLITVDEYLENKPVTVRVGQVRLQPSSNNRYTVLIQHLRPSMLSGKRASHGQFQVSRPIKHPYGWRLRSERSWPPRSISPSPPSSRALLSCRRIRGGRRIRWTFRVCCLLVAVIAYVMYSYHKKSPSSNGHCFFFALPSMCAFYGVMFCWAELMQLTEIPLVYPIDPSIHMVY